MCVLSPEGVLVVVAKRYSWKKVFMEKGICGKRYSWKKVFVEKGIRGIKWWEGLRMLTDVEYV
jgi:hypothetical protein